MGCVRSSATRFMLIATTTPAGSWRPPLVVNGQGSRPALPPQGVNLTAAHGSSDFEPSRRLVEAFRTLVQSVTVYPFPARHGFALEVKGRLAELIGPEAFPSGRAIVGDKWCRKRDSNPRPPH